LKEKKLAAANETDEYSDLTVLRQKYFGQSVWRLKSGIETLVDALVNSLKSNNNVKLYLNEPCEKISFDQNKKINVKTKHSNEKLDFVISALQAKSI
jgi:phytoene dehydrogenase-like protein